MSTSQGRRIPHPNEYIKRDSDNFSYQLREGRHRWANQHGVWTKEGLDHQVITAVQMRRRGFVWSAADRHWNQRASFQQRAQQRASFQDVAPAPASLSSAVAPVVKPAIVQRPTGVRPEITPVPRSATVLEGGVGPDTPTVERVGQSLRMTAQEHADLLAAELRGARRGRTRSSSYLDLIQNTTIQDSGRRATAGGHGA